LIDDNRCEKYIERGDKEILQSLLSSLRELEEDDIKFLPSTVLDLEGPRKMREMAI